MSCFPATRPSPAIHTWMSAMTTTAKPAVANRVLLVCTPPPFSRGVNPRPKEATLLSFESARTSIECPKSSHRGNLLIQAAFDLELDEPMRGELVELLARQRP